jgi:hypothetical protein
MIRSIFLAAALSLGLAVGHAADADKVQFKQTGNAPRDIPNAALASPTPAEMGMTFLNYQTTLKAWRSARKRLHALQASGKYMQNDPSADKEVIAMLQLMALEQSQDVENLRAQLAAILVTNKLDDPALPDDERAMIVIRAAH